MRGIIELPIEKGKKELSWIVGTAQVQGQSGASAVNPVINLTTPNDADFVARRLFLVRWPTFTQVGPPAFTVDPNLSLPDDTAVLIREGSTRRGLSLQAGFARAILPDATPAVMAAAQLGLPAPFLMRANTALLAEISRPSAAATAWQGDLLLVAEGYKVYPYLPEEIPAAIRQFAVPFSLNANGIVSNPNAAPANIAGQVITISNDGGGKFLAKRMRVRIVDSAGVDKTAALLPCLGFQITDTTSGSKNWITDQTQNILAKVPVSLLTMGGTDLFFNTPRYIDPAGSVSIKVIWSDIAAALTYVAGAAAFPVTVSVSLDGALLPR